MSKHIPTVAVAELERWLAPRPRWKLAAGRLTTRLEFSDFAGALAFVNRVGELAEKAGHHPDLLLGWGYAEVRLISHDAGGITPRDLDLAAKIDALRPDAT